MTATGAEKLVHMANQIGGFFDTQRDGAAADKIANHMRRYWEPRMRSAIIAFHKSGGAGLTPSAAEAVSQLAASEAKAGGA